MPFSDIYISQDSVATCLKHGGANLLTSLLVKNFENQKIVEVMAKSLKSCFFDSQCSIIKYCMLLYISLHNQLPNIKLSKSIRFEL